MTVTDPPTTRALGTDQGGPSLEDLLARVAAGDESALRRFYERTSAMVFGLVSRIVQRKTELRS